MRPIVIASVLVLLGISLSGCVVLSAGATVVGAGVSVVGTAVDVTGDVVGAAAGAVTGSDSDDDKKKN